MVSQRKLIKGVNMPIQPRLYQILAQHKNAGKRITLKYLAEKAGVSYKTVWRWANGETNSVNYDLLEVLCRELDCQPGDLLVYVPDDQPEHESTP